MPTKYVQISGECTVCHKLVTISVRVHSIEEYQKGAKIQDAFPYLTPGEREMLISNVCETCFDKMFKED